MRRIAIAVGLCLALALSACAAEQSPTVDTDESPAATEEATPGASGVAVTGSIVANDITSADGMTVTVAKVTLAGGNGFIAWHTDASGAPGPVVGHSALLNAGDTSDVKITLDKKITTGDYWPMLHADDDGNGKYEFPTHDAPVKSGADIVMKKIKVTVS